MWQAPWVAHPLDGIQEKLNRADENIGNLNREIVSFFNDGPYPVLPDKDDGLFQEAVDYHSSRIIPQRFSVLAGEIIHHLRSCLDHLAWILSNEEKRVRDPQGIEFPIFPWP